MVDSSVIEFLKNKNACDEALEWLSGQETLSEAWLECTRPDWMFWLLGRLKKPNVYGLVSAACDIAEKALAEHWKNKRDDRPAKAIAAAQLWVEQPTKKNVDTADAAVAAAAADAAAYAAYAAAAAAAAAARAVAYAARAVCNKTSCEIIRKHFPLSPI